MRDEGIGYTLALSGVALAAGGAAYQLGDLTLGAGAGVVTVYVLHLIRLREMRGRCRKKRVLERLTAELDCTVGTETIVTARFGPGTVALIEGIMEPREVLRAMVAARRPGGPSFGKYALEKGYVTKEQIKELMRSRKEGRFLSDEVRLARRKIQELTAG